MPIGVVPGGGHAAFLARHANEVPGEECWSSLVRKILSQIRTDPIEPGESSVFVTPAPPSSLLRTQTGAHRGEEIVVFSKGFASPMRTSETARKARSGL